MVSNILFLEEVTERESESKGFLSTIRRFLERGRGC